MARPKLRYMTQITSEGDAPEFLQHQNLEDALKEIKTNAEHDAVEEMSFMLYKEVPIRIHRDVLVNIKLNGHKRKKHKNGDI